MRPEPVNGATASSGLCEGDNRADDRIQMGGKLEGSDEAVRASVDTLRAMDRDDPDHCSNAALVVETTAEGFAQHHEVTLEMRAWEPYGVVTGVEITDLFAEHPGQGSGSKVMEAVASLADASGLGVFLRPSSARNREFYGRHGFQSDRQHHGMMVRYSALDPELAAECGIDQDLPSDRIVAAKTALEFLLSTRGKKTMPRA